MLRLTPFRWLVLALLTAALAIPSPSQETTPGRIPVPRAARPTFSDRQIEATYFSDLPSQALVGERPESLGRVATGGSGGGADSTGGSGTTTGAPEGSGSTFAWSSLIEADVIEDQIKQLKLAMDANITTPVKFAGGGYDVARQDFTVLATLFGIVNDYDAQVRWKNDAAALRDAFSRAAGNCKTGSPQAYAEAKQRKQDLSDVVGGNAFVAAGEVEQVNNWPTICDRSPLMDRLQVALDRLKAATASEGSFKGQAAEIRVEASMTAAIAHILAIEGMEDAVEDDYNKMAVEMKEAASDLVSAVKTDTYDDAVVAIGVLGQSCDRCHNDWR